jgi:[citrate (pro-3S)-lyase] ligase
VLPEHGVELVEIERLADGQTFISATRVREALARLEFDLLAPLVPEPTLAFLRSPDGLALAATLRQASTGS